jgi:hypothetical protein
LAPHFFLDVLLGQVSLDEGVAVGTAILMKENDDPSAFIGRFLNIVGEFEEAFLEPLRIHGLHPTEQVAGFRPLFFRHRRQPAARQVCGGCQGSGNSPYCLHRHSCFALSVPVMTAGSAGCSAARSLN